MSDSHPFSPPTPDPSRRGEGLAVAGGALAVAVAYYLGARLGFVLHIPPAFTSVLWPPNAILTAVLMVSRPRHWWIYLLAALPAHWIVNLGSPMPALVLPLFVTNCLEALLAAGGVRLLNEGPVRFNSLRRVGSFVISAALVAPLLSSIPDPLLVSSQTGEPFGLVFRTRFFSNVLGQLALVPALVVVLTQARVWAKAPRRRLIEAALLTVGLAASGVLVFVNPSSPGFLPGLSRTTLFLFLSFLIWGAVRFGAAGASLTFLTTTMIAIGAVIARAGPFANMTAEEGVLAVQLTLTATGVPLLFLAGVIEERERARAMLQDESRFESLLARLSAAFVHPNEEDLESTLHRGLAQLGLFLGLDRMTLFEVRTNGHQPEDSTIVTWTAPASDPVCGGVSERQFPWVFEQLRQDRGVTLGRTEEVGDIAPTDADSLRASGVRSILVLPVTDGHSVRWGVAFISLSRPMGWPHDTVGRLKVVTSVFGHALERRRAEVELRQMQQELAHVTRISTMGQLTVSLAHQLNQPLAAILTNANAGTRLLKRATPDLDEIRNILLDVGEDVRRARDVIRYLRSFMRKEEAQQLQNLDLNELVRDVARVVESDAVIRRVSLSLHLAPAASLVHGDRVQLQQVVLNLLLNAFDATIDNDELDRHVLVRVGNADGRGVELSIEDNGKGFGAMEPGRLFEPFFTTKPSGLGVGLSIVQTIVENHQGSIAALSNPSRGATFRVALPSAEAFHP